MQRGERGVTKATQERELQQIRMKMDDIELLTPLTEAFHHQQMLKHRIAAFLAQSQRDLARGDEFGCCLRIT
jgi:hypothetical protein